MVRNSKPDIKYDSTTIQSQKRPEVGSAEEEPEVFGEGREYITSQVVSMLQRMRPQTRPQVQKQNQAPQFVGFDSSDNIKVTYTRISSQASSQTDHSREFSQRPQDLCSSEPHYDSQNTPKEHCEENSRELEEPTKVLTKVLRTAEAREITESSNDHEDKVGDTRVEADSPGNENKETPMRNILSTHATMKNGELLESKESANEIKVFVESESLVSNDEGFSSLRVEKLDLAVLDDLLTKSRRSSPKIQVNSLEHLKAIFDRKSIRIWNRVRKAEKCAEPKNGDFNRLDQQSQQTSVFGYIKDQIIATGIKLETILFGTQHILDRARPPKGKKRIRWMRKSKRLTITQVLTRRKRCGHEIRDNFHELKEGAAERYRQDRGPTITLSEL